MREPLLLVPGMMSDARVFAPQIAALSRDMTLQVANVTVGDSIREIAQNVLDCAPERFALAGHSMGGIVAMEILRRAPQRVNRLALISTTPLPDTPAQASWREPQIVRASAGRLEEALKDAFRPEILAPGPQQSAHLKLMYEMAFEQGNAVFVRQSRALQRRPDAQRTLRQLKVPTMVLCGAHDTLTPPKRHEIMAELIPSAELVVLPNAGHLPMLECPEEVNIGMRAWMEMPLELR